MDIINFDIRSKPNPDYAHFAGQNLWMEEPISGPSTADIIVSASYSSTLVEVRPGKMG
jgi:hypothetical protein